MDRRWYPILSLGLHGEEMLEFAKTGIEDAELLTLIKQSVTRLGPSEVPTWAEFSGVERGEHGE
jgi:hypothetical protein